MFGRKKIVITRHNRTKIFPRNPRITLNPKQHQTPNKRRPKKLPHQSQTKNPALQNDLKSRINAKTQPPHHKTNLRRNDPKTKVHRKRPRSFCPRGQR